MANEDSGQEKTLDPTQRRLDKAREEGQFAQSQDLTTLVLVSIAALAVWVAGSRLLDSLVNAMRSALSFSDPSRVLQFLFEWLQGPISESVFWIVLVLALLFLASLFGPLALVNFEPKLAALKFDPERLSPINGLKRIFSTQGLSQLGLSTLKAILVFLAIGIYLWFVIDDIFAFPGMSVAHSIFYGLALVGGGLFVLIAMALVLGVTGCVS